MVINNIETWLDEKKIIISKQILLFSKEISNILILSQKNFILDSKYI
jgi:hypothetical protein